PQGTLSSGRRGSSVRRRGPSLASLGAISPVVRGPHAAIALTLVAVDHVAIDQVRKHVLELVAQRLAQAGGSLWCGGPAVRRPAGQIIDDALLEGTVVAAGLDRRPGLLLGPVGGLVEMQRQSLADDVHLVCLVDPTHCSEELSDSGVEAL